MAFDGLAVSNLTYEFDRLLTGGRIAKIYQPENDELILTVKNNGGTYRLLLSASATLPLAYITEENRANPATAPNFCMLLRKHISGGRILSITQPSLERVIIFEIEHLNEMGDLCRKQLIVELMGKHSNIIFCRPDHIIIDSIKHISSNISSVREVLPGRTYFIPDTQNKCNPLDLSEDAFRGAITAKDMPLSKAIYNSYTGISPAIAAEICFRADVDPGLPARTLPEPLTHALYSRFADLMAEIKAHHYSPNIIYQNGEPLDFSVTEMWQYKTADEPKSAAAASKIYTVVHYDRLSPLLEHYYAEKSALTRIRQKSADLRRITGTALDRCRKKYALQLKQMKDTEKRDKYKLYGELINTYGYGLEPEARALTCLNYYTNEEITIPLDPQLDARENAVRYFNKYNKLKRTSDALGKLTLQTKSEIEHLDSISTALDIALCEDDLAQIKEELMDFGYIKRRAGGKNRNRQKISNQPLHYISSDGFHMYVGKNNIQNEELTFKMASGNDWWFHAKGIPGSHVIVRTENGELPDAAFEEAGRLAAYYSMGRAAEKV